MTDASGLLYLRARTRAPRLGVFTALDPYEGSAARPMSLKRRPYRAAHADTVLSATLRRLLWQY